MRILVVHNAYQQLGGEDSVVDAEVNMLLGHGHLVRYYGRTNDNIDSMSRLSLVGQTFWSSRTTKELADLIDSFKPKIIHVHNTFPLISPSLYWAAAKAGVPVVQTLHNFRLLCPQAMFLREGSVCEDCLGHIPWRGIVHGCYRESQLQSAVLAGMITMHRGIGTWRNKIARYISLNEFCRQKFIEGGLPAERIVVKPNFVDFSEYVESFREGFLFVGRLSVEKGLSTLVKAMAQLTDAHLRVAGAGSEAIILEDVPGVTHIGSLSGEKVRIEMSQVMALVVPSIWYETFGMVIIEAFSMSTPVIASRIGALAELVEDGVTGLLFETGNVDDLANKLKWAMQNPEKMREMGRNAHIKYEREYTANQNYDQLIAIYRDAIEESKIKSLPDVEN